MSAELLRQAATILRERAEAVDNREDWREHYEDCELVMYPAEGRDDAQFIALLSPDFGLAVADLLDKAAETWELAEPHQPSGATLLGANVARLIVGGQP